MPSIQNGVSHPQYSRLSLKMSAMDNDVYDDEAALFDEGSQEEWEPLQLSTPQSGSGVQCLDPVENKCRHAKALINICKKIFRFTFTNIWVLILLLVIGKSVPIGLGYYAFFKLEPRVVLDKSVNSFQIPNHPASKKILALKKAVDGNILKYRSKRDLHMTERDSDNDDSFDAFEKISNGNEYRSIPIHDRLTKEKYAQVLYEDMYDSIRKSVNKFFEDAVKEESKITEESPARHNRPHVREKRYLGKRSLPAPDYRYGSTLRARRWKMMLVYFAEGENDDNIFTKERLETVHKIEHSILSAPGFNDYCYIDHSLVTRYPHLNRYGGCAPPNSLLTYFYPSQNENGAVYYDGLGSTQVDINNTLRFAMTKNTFYWYVDDKISSQNMKSRLLRSEVMFGAPLPGYHSVNDRKEEQEQKFTHFVSKYVDSLTQMSTDKVRVVVGGTQLFDYQVERTFWNDIRLALFAVGFIVVFMFVLTSFSLWLTYWGMTSILLSFPLAFYFYRGPMNHTSLGILNGAAAFVIVGIGVDDVFVFVNTFRQAYKLQDLSDRMVYTVLTAGKATFFTSFTTAAAFAANIASGIPAIHDFGLCMSLIVCCCWLLVVMIMPPAINIWYRLFANCEQMCYKCCLKCGGSCGPSIPEDMSRVIDEGEVTNRSMGRHGDDDDVPMLPVDNVNSHEEFLTEDDDPMIVLENELSLSVSQGQDSKGEGCSLTLKLQALTYHCLAEPFVKFRWIIFGGFIVLLAVSIGMITQLKFSTKPPQLFRAGSNLQLWTDLATNFSNSDISCNECSALYKENIGHVNPPTVGTTHTNTVTEQTSTALRKTSTTTAGMSSTTSKSSSTAQPGIRVTKSTMVPSSKASSAPVSTTISAAISRTSSIPAKVTKPLRPPSSATAAVPSAPVTKPTPKPITKKKKVPTATLR